MLSGLAGRPQGCRFWQEAACGVFATAPTDHDLYGIGTFTHNLEATSAHEADRRDALKVFADLGYVREQDLEMIPVLQSRPRFVVYGPLAEVPVTPDVVLLFVTVDQTLILSEATQQEVEGGLAPDMGRPACAIVPQAVNTGRAALSHPLEVSRHPAQRHRSRPQSHDAAVACSAAGGRVKPVILILKFGQRERGGG